MSDSLRPMNYTVHGILQARILDWVALPSSRGSSQPRDRTPTQGSALKADVNICDHGNLLSQLNKDKILKMNENFF